MRVLISPDKFAGTMDAAQAARAIAAGWREIRPRDDVQLSPMADGGEGTLQVVQAAVSGAVTHTVEVADARGLASNAQWLELPDGRALLPVSGVCGITAMSAEYRDPLRTTTYGVGQLVAAVAASHPAGIIIGLGGSATVDGGVGMISALTGHSVRRADGNAVKVGGRWVAQVDHLASSFRVPAADMVIASDVTNPLLGPSGAARVFGPQKGADHAGVAELERALTQWADVAERDLPGGPWRDLPGAGAAGGLGFALMALLDATMRSGAQVVAELTGFDPSHSDVVITGEGSLDAQTDAGKVPAEVARQARRAGALTVALAGRISDGAGERFDVVEELGPDGLKDPEGTLGAAARRAAQRVADLVRSA